MLAACSQSTTYYGAQADELHGRALLVLQPILLAPTPPPVHEAVVQRIDKALAEVPGIGPVTGRSERNRANLPLGAADAYDLYSSTLSLTGMSDPQLSRRMGELLQVELLAMAQPVFIACAVCDEGDQLWLVGQIVEARTGRVVFRAHTRAPVSGEDAQAMASLADEMTRDYLQDLALAFQLRPHKQRFEHLRHVATR